MRTKIAWRETLGWLGWLSCLGLAWLAGAVPAADAQTAISADGAIESQSGGFIFPDGSVQTTALAPGLAPVGRSGQTNCWDAAGNPLSCDGTGQDGDRLAGEAWPVPRLTDNNNGTVTDHLTGLIWLKDATCLGLFAWSSGLAAANGLSAGSCGLTDGSVAGDWRTPNVRELLSLVSYGATSPALPKGAPFTNVEIFNRYWTSTTVAEQLDSAWTVSFSVGGAEVWGKPGVPSVAFLWPVRDGE